MTINGLVEQTPIVLTILSWLKSRPISASLKKYCNIIEFNMCILHKMKIHFDLVCVVEISFWLVTPFIALFSHQWKKNLSSLIALYRKAHKLSHCAYFWSARDHCQMRDRKRFAQQNFAPHKLFLAHSSYNHRLHSHDNAHVRALDHLKRKGRIRID